MVSKELPGGLVDFVVVALWLCGSCSLLRCETKLVRAAVNVLTAGRVLIIINVLLDTRESASPKSHFSSGVRPLTEHGLQLKHLLV